MWKDKKVRQKKVSQRWGAIDKPYSKASETIDHRENLKQLRAFQPLMLQSKKKKGSFSLTDQNVIPTNKLIKVIGNLSTTYFTAEYGCIVIFPG